MTEVNENKRLQGIVIGVIGMKQQRLNQSQLTMLYAEQKNNPGLRLGQILSNKFDIPKDMEDVIYEMNNNQFNTWLDTYQMVDYSKNAKGLTLRVK